MGYEQLGEPQSRNEAILMNMLGASYQLEDPQSRVEFLLQEILNNGGGGGGGGTSTVAWKPTVAADGTITWTRTSSTTAPDPQNIMGPSGPAGAQGAAGATGPTGPVGPAGPDGFSPTITVVPITGGHRVTVTDVTGSKSFDVLDGQADSIDWSKITNVPVGLVEDQDYVHTDNNFTDADKTKLANAAEAFVAEYNVTTAQEIIEFINGTHEPCAPMVMKRGTDYYTVITAAKVADNRAIIRTFATLSGNFYIFTYDITDAQWANSNYGVQKILVSGTDIKTINGQSLLGSGNIEVGGGGTSDWDSIINKPTDLAEAVELTQAEYDALSDEEKKNGKIYFITDGEGGGAVDPIIFDLTQSFVYTEVDAAIDSKKPIGFVDAVGNTIWATGIQSDTEGRYFTGYFRGNSYSIIAREVETAWDVRYSAVAMKEYVDSKLTDGAWETNQGGYVTINPRLKNGWACIALNGGYLKKDIPVGSTTITTLGNKYKPTTSITVPLMVLPERIMSGTVSVDISGNVIVNTPTAIEVGGGTRSLCASLVYPV